jgi:hypothetical protein
MTEERRMTHPAGESGGTVKRTMTLDRLRQLTASIPGEAQLHGYLHSSGTVTIQAEWTAEDEHGDGAIMNPVIFRVQFEITAGASVSDPDWATYFDASESITTQTGRT